MGEALIELALLKDIIWHGIIQSCLLWIPLLKPLVEPWIPPWWWVACYGADHWQENLDAEHRPTELFMHYWWRCFWQHVHFLIMLSARWIAEGIIDVALSLLGALNEAYETFAEWIYAISDRIGDYLPDWATSFVDGLLVLWGLLPDAIRDSVQTWADIWEEIKEAIREWARARYDEARLFAYEVWGWYVGIGLTITMWWMSWQGWIVDFFSDVYGTVTQALGAAWLFLVWFWNNPVGAVAVWLAPWWIPLTTFARDCLEFWYNLWGSYAQELADFLEDPLEFLWQRGEAWMNRRLEQS